MAEVRRTVQLGDELSEAEIVQAATALQEMTQTEGWRLFIRQVERVKYRLATDGIRMVDPDFPPRYFAGGLDVLDVVFGGVTDLVGKAAEIKKLKEDRKHRGQHTDILRSGIGSVAE